MSNKDEDLLVTHAKDQRASAWRVPISPLTLTPESTSKIASEMHRWGRLTGAFSIILMVIWLVVGAVSSASQPVSQSGSPGGTIVSSPSPEVAALGSSLLWPGVVLAILAVIGLFAGFGFDYLAGRKR